jgi:hypothetical protein
LQERTWKPQLSNQRLSWTSTAKETSFARNKKICDTGFFYYYLSLILIMNRMERLIGAVYFTARGEKLGLLTLILHL